MGMLTEQKMSRREEFAQVKDKLEELDREASKYLSGNDLKSCAIAMKNCMDKYFLFEYYIKQEEQGHAEETEEDYRKNIIGYVEPFLGSLETMIELAKEK
ncbi:MAG TPA: hypothetical protein VI815_03755 [Candidatus Nanoarchaeia archaeon]|nr:hypothetical protein [Candidatus Nanoarchaeia archaeon]